MHHTLNQIRIAGLAVSVGAETKDFRAEGLKAGRTAAQLERVARTVGLNQRQVVTPGVTALDLCEDAARRLLSAMDLEPTSLDAIIFVTQTPDHSQPCNAAILHGRLGLSASAAAFDISLGCSGWVYGLHQAALLAAQAGRVLLCAGDTLSTLTHPEDHALHPLFGDAGSATIVEKTGQSNPWHFCLGTDGSRAAAIQVPAGGARQPLEAISLEAISDADGNRRRPDQLSMDGAEVFNFSLREVPPAVKVVMQMASWTPMEADALILHQANRFLVSSLGNKCGFPAEKVPANLGETYGNQSSASLPAALLHSYSHLLTHGRLKVVACGFGVGLSWGAWAAEIGPCVMVPIQPYKK
jgi:3-oxoacyl-[acyl-carrier-protein] synthase-3